MRKGKRIMGMENNGDMKGKDKGKNVKKVQDKRKEKQKRSKEDETIRKIKER